LVGTPTYYIGDDIELRKSGTNIINIQQYAGVSRRVVDNGTEAPEEFYIKNHLGSTITTVDDNGAQASELYEYFPYGKQIVFSHTSNAAVTKTFTGKELDRYDESVSAGSDGEGLYYFGKRYFDADIGKWTSGDPKPQYYDYYNYCGGNPTNRIDPNGAQTGLPPTDYVMLDVCLDILSIILPFGIGKIIKEARAARLARTEAEIIEATAAAEKAAAKSTLQITAHGSERIAGEAATRGGVLSKTAIQDVRQGGRVMTQADGATVRILQNETGRFNVVVEGDRGIITTFENLSQKSLNRLGENYGWH
jgi:RHS repeat-associated protein